MLRSLKSVLKCEINAIDENLGIVDDCYFDGLEWRIRYFVVDTGNWLTGRRVLLSPVAVDGVDWPARQLHVKVTKRQVEGSPSVEAHVPVSRQMENEIADYYGWPVYWGPQPAAAAPPVSEKAASDVEPNDDGHSNLCSMNEVTGYAIEARDGSIGHVEEFIADDEDWTIRYIVVDTRNWLPGRKVLIAPWMIRTVRWDEKNVAIEMTRDQVKDAPEYDPAAPVNRAYETRFYDYYGRPI